MTEEYQLMAVPTFLTLKKTYFYDFLPTKADEEANKNLSQPPRTLIEIRDVYAPPIVHPQNPWIIRKTLTPFEIESGMITVSFNDTFEHILRYWTLPLANDAAILRRKITVILWDVTEDTNPKNYQGNDVYFQIAPDDSYVLSCGNMMRDRRLQVDDYIGLYWNIRDSNFRFKSFYSNLS